MTSDATAYVHRDAYFDIFVDSFWPGESNDVKKDKEDKEKAFVWLDNCFNSKKNKQFWWSNHYYQNYPNSKYANWQECYFGSNYSRLQEVKAK